jgi:broad specificity phosphatase PhoE
MSILWLRHGQTALNAARIVQPADTPLSALGRAQAAAAAARVAALRPAALLASDLPRARQTAEALAAATGLPLHTGALLRERDFGAWRGRPLAELPADATAHPAAPPGGESLADFLARVTRAWAQVTAWRKRLDGPLVVVSHGLLIQAMLQQHARWPAGVQPPAVLGNTALSIVDPPPVPWVRLAGCTAHLRPLGDTGPGAADLQANDAPC